ncbi:MAG TPA: gas vesicle protein GvpJ [Terriglobales bacterium]|nr:gas vesicle protein GvpJ [Terriglobales bacterium]
MRIEPNHASLIDILERLLDNGIVLDAWVRLQPKGIDLRKIAPPIVAASIQTYLRYEVAVISRLRIRTGRSAQPSLAPGCLHVGPKFIDILDRILDKGIVMDPWDRIRLMAPA